MKAGKYIQDRMRNHPGLIRIAELQGTSGSTPSIQLSEEALEAISKRRGNRWIIFSQSAPADFTEDNGKQVMKEFLQVPEDERPQVLFAHNDEMAFGAIQAIEEVGLKPGEDIIIVSVDGSRKALEILASGKINAVVECNRCLVLSLCRLQKKLLQGVNSRSAWCPRRIFFPTKKMLDGRCTTGDSRIREKLEHFG